MTHTDIIGMYLDPGPNFPRSECYSHGQRPHGSLGFIWAVKDCMVPEALM